MVSDAVLQRPLAWRDPSLIPMLAQLQGNILKGHGRAHTRNLFLRFGGQSARTRRALADLAHKVTSAIEQLSAGVRYRADGTSGGPVCFFFLSAAGYRALGVEESAMPADPAFREGMGARGGRLGDPSPDQWETAFRTPVHALLLLGADSGAEADGQASRIAAALAGGGIDVVAVERGAASNKCGPRGPNEDHLGQHGGNSQPLMLTDDVAGVGTANGGRFGWDPTFGPGQLALVRDPGNANEDAFGSYLVFRKLEENVAAFDRAERGLALTFDAAQPAGAQGVPAGLALPANDRWDTAAPSADAVHRFHADPAIDRARLMPRRTIAYHQAERTGLLFMTYNQDIARQFEFVQAHTPCACSAARQMRGGDYFFAPSIGFLTGLSDGLGPR